MARILLLESNIGAYMFGDGTGELWYASCVAKELAPVVRGLGHEVIEVEAPSPEAANTAIAQYRPHLVWWIGHGSENVTTLERVELWISAAPDYNVDILNDTVACAESCLTGVYLGPYLVTARACKAYLGYRDLYYFPWCGTDYPCQCRGDNPHGVRPEIWSVIVRSMHDATFHFVIGLARGMSVSEAFNYSIARFDYWIDYLSRVAPRDSTEEAVIRTAIWVLAHDKSVQVLRAKDLGTRIPVPVLAQALRSLALGAAASAAAFMLTLDPVISAASGALASVAVHRRLLQL